MKPVNFTSAALLLSLGLVGAPAVAQDEFGDSTPYYEDDGWLDVTEWFDGNDYNPTDEAWWRWDDETYQSSRDTGSDTDSDWYGYTEGNDNDWYYDYYDPYTYGYYGYDNNRYDYGARYYDYDDDGLYDAYVSYSDWNGDGVYEDYNYYSFNNSGTNQQATQSRQNAMKDGKQQSVTGTIENVKKVKVRDGGEHVVADIKPQAGNNQNANNQSGKNIVVDLGRADRMSGKMPQKGQTITAMGPRTMVGDKSILIAQTVQMDGNKMQVNRNTREVTGTITSMHTAQVKGKQQQLAMVEVKQEGKTRKVAVDLGHADKLDAKLSEGDNITFSGMPVKANDRLLILATSLTVDGDTQQIERKPARDNAGATNNQKQKSNVAAGSNQSKGMSDADAANKN